MPVVKLYYEDMERLIGASKERIMGRLAMMGADIGKRAEEEYVDVEFFPDRPDLYSAEGVARAMRGFLGLETGLVEYPIEKGSITLQVEESVLEVRPVIGCAVVRGLSEQCGDAGGYVHLGATSNDIIDTATAIQLKAAMAIITKDCRGLRDTMLSLAEKHRRTPMVGRSA